MLNNVLVSATVALLIFPAGIAGVSRAAEAPSTEKQAHFNGLIFVTPAMTNDILLPTNLPDFRYRSNEISIFAAPGEYEPATFSIYAMTELKDVTVEAGVLKGVTKNIPAPAVDIRVVKCWYQGGHPNRPGDVKFLNPELLLKDDDFLRIDTEKLTNILKSPDAPRDADELQPVTIPVDTQKQFWVTVHVPEDALPGNYQGVIRIETADGGSARIKLALEVLPIILAEPMLEYMIYYGAGRLDPAGVGECTRNPRSEYVLLKSEEQYRAELRNLKAHGITQPMIAQDPVQNPDGSYDFSLLERAMTLVQEAGFGEIPLLYLPYGRNAVGTQKTPEAIEEMLKWVEGVITLSEKHGFTDAYFYGIDEAKDEALPAERLAWQAVRDAGGKVFVSAYAGFFDVVGDLLDLDLFGTAPVVKDVADKMRALGHRMYGMRNSPVHTTSTPLTTRCNYGLGNWLAGFDGSCDFSYQFAHGNIYDDSDNQNWDYVYAYPTVNGVIDTLQWEGWREAVDDIRYLTTLLQAIEQAKAKGGGQTALCEDAERWVAGLRAEIDAEKFYRNTKNWFGLPGDNVRGIDPRINFEGRDMQDIRRQMATWILRLQGGVQQ